MRSCLIRNGNIHSTYRHRKKFFNDFSKPYALDSSISNHTEIENISHTNIYEAKNIQKPEWLHIAWMEKGFGWIVRSTIIIVFIATQMLSHLLGCLWDIHTLACWIRLNHSSCMQCSFLSFFEPTVNFNSRNGINLT